MKLLLALGVVLLLRAPFLNQAIQGDDVYYLYGAEHAQIEPAHPHHVRYVFRGDLVDMEGHTHPPLDAWILGALLALLGDIREVPFHAAYILFSLIAAASMWSLARRFSPHPLWATLLFLVTPAFVINGNSLEADIPFLALWMAAVALFVAERYMLAALALALASLAAYQAIFLMPILAVYTWLFARRSKAAWAAILAAPVTMVAWQLFELAGTGELPAGILVGHFQTYGFQSFANKLHNAEALSVHACCLVFPALLPPAFLASYKRRDPDTIFLLSWITIFFAAMIATCFAGSARYLLPMAAPVALLVSRLNAKWLAAGFAVQAILSVSLAVVNYQHWDGCRAFAESLRPQLAGKRVWINAEWGLLYYLESDGGIPLRREQTIHPGEVVVSSELSAAHFTTSGGALTPIATREIRPALPLRLLALHTRSAYSTVDRGFLPFDISTGPIDRLCAETVTARDPTLQYLPMNAPEAEWQLVSGVSFLEDETRWMAEQAVILLKSPAAPTPVRVKLYISASTPARRVTLQLDGEQIASETYAQPGIYTLETRPILPSNPTATLTITVDKTFSVPGDRRVLGVVLIGAGFL